MELDITHEKIGEITQRILNVSQPEKIIMFGSYARGTSTPNSDVDLLVILPFEGRPFHKSLEILNHLDVRFPCDLIARPPDDVARRYNQGDPLIREALDHGKVLYERDG